MKGKTNFKLESEEKDSIFFEFFIAFFGVFFGDLSMKMGLGMVFFIMGIGLSIASCNLSGSNSVNQLVVGCVLLVSGIIVLSLNAISIMKKNKEKDFRHNNENKNETE